MDKKAKIALVSALVVAALILAAIVVAAPRAKKACSDGFDNDGDSYIDWPADPGCANKNDNSELGTVECDDGSDNDGDNDVDYNDAGCSGPTDDDETNCGDDICEGGEDCDNCAADCLGVGQVCCSGVAYWGDCCDNNDCFSPEECVDHYCLLPNSCSDTDGGYLIYVRGTVSGYLDETQYEYTDYCVNDSILIEHYCLGNDWYDDVFDCTWTNMTTCVNGACVEA
ncbi:hypothetical protein JW930_01520 [Candidatus Woesearchaeota archaeon]|nr:hypothetical protein [Candidatus Woesearchaeota archaeon]